MKSFIIPISFWYLDKNVDWASNDKLLYIDETNSVYLHSGNSDQDLTDIKNMYPTAKFLKLPINVHRGELEDDKILQKLISDYPKAHHFIQKNLTTIIEKA